MTELRCESYNSYSTPPVDKRYAFNACRFSNINFCGRPRPLSVERCEFSSCTFPRSWKKMLQTQALSLNFCWYDNTPCVCGAEKVASEIHSDWCTAK